MAKEFFRVSEEPQITNDRVIGDIVGSYPDKNKILLFGEVQSGKTNNIIKIILGLFDANKIDYVFYFTGNTVDLKKQNFDRLHKALPLRGIEMVDASAGFLRLASNESVNKNKVVFTVLKQYFNSVEKYIRENFPGKRVLIIDDEADDYSNSESNSKTIVNLINLGVGLISCTATPFTNLYLNEDIYDSYQKLVPWNGYCGRKSFDENYFEIKENYDFDMTNLIALLKWAKITYENKLENSQLLFNTDNSTEYHKLDNKSIMELIEEIKYNKHKHQEFFQDMMKESIDIEKAVLILTEVQSQNGIKQLNSNKGNALLLNKGYEIIFGGILLSRGITYENLIVEVYRNFGQKTTAHTLVQRSRWFGYREKNKKNMLIMLEEKAIKAFDEIEQLYNLTLNHEINTGLSYKNKLKSELEKWERITI